MSKKNIRYPIINVIVDPNDRYGVEYKKKLELRLCPCICCNIDLAPNIILCAICKYEYHFCKICIKSKEEIMNFDRCIFCERKKNDKIITVLNDCGYNFPNLNKFDLFGNEAIDMYINEIDKLKKCSSI